MTKFSNTGKKEAKSTSCETAIRQEKGIICVRAMTKRKKKLVSFRKIEAF